MKRLLAIAIAAILVAVAIGSTMTWAQSDDDNNDASKSVELAVGDSWRLALDSNPTTGYQWQLASRTDEAVLELDDHAYEPSETHAGLCGAGGKELWTFTAIKKGETTLTLEYGQPWKGGSKSAKTLVVTVVVR